MEPLQWNTLEEAASWFANTTAQEWDARRVLSAALDCPDNSGRMVTTYLSAILPKETQFGVYQKLADGSLSFKFYTPWQTVRLFPDQVRELISSGHTETTLASVRKGENGADEFVFIEPLHSRQRITMGMVGLTVDDISGLHFLGLALEKWPPGPKVFPLNIHSAQDMNPNQIAEELAGCTNMKDGIEVFLESFRIFSKGYEAGAKEAFDLLKFCQDMGDTISITKMVAYIREKQPSPLAIALLVIFAKDAARKETSRRANEVRNETHNAAKKQLLEKWATGLFSTRDGCADEEWEACGFDSYDKARYALRKSPAPNPWPAKNINKRRSS